MSKLKETHHVYVKRKQKHSPSLASCYVIDIDSNEEMQIKFQGANDVNVILDKVSPGQTMIVEGVWTINSKLLTPEFAVKSFEVFNKQKATYISSDKVEYLDFSSKQKKRASN